jgi:hypothetical protein
MLVIVTQIQITQVPTIIYPDRNQCVLFKSVCEFSADDGWEDLTNQAKITLPKISTQEIINNNLISSNLLNKRLHLNNPNINLSGFIAGTPQFLRGDQVTITCGYRYLNAGGGETTDTALMFQGYISKVKAGKPFKLECEDNMWLLKQKPAKGGVNGVFSCSTYTVEAMVAELFANAGLPFTVNSFNKETTLSVDFRVDRLTIAEVLEKLRKEALFISYFRGNELRCGLSVYDLQHSNTYNFDFQKNIISNDLEYQRKDDIVLSAIGVSKYATLTGGVTKDGKSKTKIVKLQVLCTYTNGNFTSIVKNPGDNTEFPENLEGERHSFQCANITDPNELIKRTKAQLLQYYYTGYRGTFTTFGVPFVRMGDKVNLTDAVLPERNGVYIVKKVDYSLSVDGGLRQKIKLDRRLLYNNT